MVQIVSHEFEDVASRVATWPTVDQLALVQRILVSRSDMPPDDTAPGSPKDIFNIVKDLPRPAISEPAKTMSLEQVIGIVKISDPPTDADCEQILAEERMRKYG